MADEQQVTHLSPSERDDVPEGRYGGPATIDNPPAENSRGYDRKAAAEKVAPVKAAAKKSAPPRTRAAKSTAKK